MEQRDPSSNHTHTMAHDGREKPETTLVEDLEAAGHAQVYKRHGRVVSSLPFPALCLFHVIENIRIWNPCPLIL